MNENFYAALKSVSPYRTLLDEQAGTSLVGLFGALERGEGEQAMDQYTALFEQITAAGWDSLGDWFLERMRYGVGPFAEAAARGEESEALARAAAHDIDVFRRIALLPCKELKNAIAACLPESWGEGLSVRTEGTGTDASMASFGIGAGDGRIEILRIYTFSGENRETLAAKGGRVLLSREGETIYSAELLEAGAFTLTEDSLRQRFHRISRVWTLAGN